MVVPFSPFFFLLLLLFLSRFYLLVVPEQKTTLGSLSDDQNSHTLFRFPYRTLDDDDNHTCPSPRAAPPSSETVTNVVDCVAFAPLYPGGHANVARACIVWITTRDVMRRMYVYCTHTHTHKYPTPNTLKRLRLKSSCRSTFNFRVTFADMAPLYTTI